MATNEVLGLGGVTPDRVKDGDDNSKPREPREGVGTAGEIERTPASRGLEQTKGATGIDMGAGGNGTDIEP